MIKIECFFWKNCRQKPPRNFFIQTKFQIHFHRIHHNFSTHCLQEQIAFATSQKLSKLMPVVLSSDKKKRCHYTFFSWKWVMIKKDNTWVTPYWCIASYCSSFTTLVEKFIKDSFQHQKRKSKSKYEYFNTCISNTTWVQRKYFKIIIQFAELKAKKKKEKKGTAIV